MNLHSLDPDDLNWRLQWGRQALAWSTRPRWTGSHARQVCLAALGPGAGTASLATHFRVSASTARRWMSSSARSRTELPAVRVGELMVPPADTERRRRSQVDYARQQAAALARNRRTALLSWSQQGWLQPHFVLLVAASKGNAIRVVVARDLGTSHKIAIKARQIVAARRAENYFAATADAGWLIEQCASWRVYPSSSAVSTGRTMCVLSSSPIVDALRSLGPIL